ncbi:MAG: ATP-binding protein [candidate division Zixibacteria bacterium]|nr:ATP-binding protein [candidate division Zixibacteria bacterium]
MLKPGIIARLSHLIIIQVLFIFAALALILFVPGSELQPSTRLTALERDVAKAARQVTDRLHDEWLVAGGRGEIAQEGLWHCLDSLALIEHAALVRIGDSSRISFLFVYERAGSNAGQEAGSRDLSSFLSLDVLRDMAADKSRLPQPVLDSRHLTYYQAVDCGSTVQPAVLVLAAEHELAISGRSSLQYTVLILFLCSALVSLLTVSLLMRKFKRPLDRIISGLEETAEGKLHHLADLETDPELGRLATAYNNMAQRLWNHRRQLGHYFGEMETANAELKESQSFLRTLIDSSPLGVVVADPDGRIILFNRASAAEFGYQPHEIVGCQFSALLAEKLDRPATSVDPEGRGGFEVICRRGNGALFPAYIISSEVRADDGRHLANLYVCRDITESRDFQEMMIRLDRYYTRGEMAGDIAHEINNYLAVLMGNVELFPRILKKGDPEQITKKLEVMHASLQKIACFSDGLLDSPSDKVCLEPASLNQIVESVIAFLKPQNKFDTVAVIKELYADLPVVYVDASQVQQLLVNLVYNSAEALAGKEDERQIWVSTSIVESVGQPAVQIVVRDNGPGVAQDKEHLLFTSRFTTKRRGHGIGLITCRKITDNHGGTISYEHRDGAVFSVVLPVGVRPSQDSDPSIEGSPIQQPDIVHI